MGRCVQRGKGRRDAAREAWKPFPNSLNAQPRVLFWSLTSALAVAKQSRSVTCPVPAPARVTDAQAPYRGVCGIHASSCRCH